MPSNALASWKSDRLPRLNEFETQCSASLALVPANPALADENLRAFVMLLSAHFQGFCRDLHSECVLAIANVSPASLQFSIQMMGISGRRIDGSNPRYATIRSDFERIGLDLAVVLATDPANQPRITALDHLNLWRNYAAHHLLNPPSQGGPFDLPKIAHWKTATNEFAVELDSIVYNHLQALTGLPPW